MSPQGLVKVVVGSGGGIAFVATTGVSLGVCPCVSPTSRVRSIETARSSFACVISTALCLGATGGIIGGKPGLSCFQGSTVVVGELQLNAAGESVGTGGMLCRAGATSTARGVGMVVFVRRCPLAVLGSGGAGVSQ